jgi:hypothetical protein
LTVVSSRCELGRSDPSSNCGGPVETSDATFEELRFTQTDELGRRCPGTAVHRSMSARRGWFSTRRCNSRASTG